MKTYFIFIISIISIGLMAFNDSEKSPNHGSSFPQDANTIDIPENVQAVLDRSCLPCHGAEGSAKARVKWKYEKMSEYATSKLVSKYIKISEKVDEDKMPPAKDVRKHPERKLSPEEKILIKKWAENAADKLVGKAE